MLFLLLACAEPVDFEQAYCPDDQVMVGQDCVPLDELFPEEEDTGLEGCPEYEGDIYVGIDADACEVPEAGQAVTVECDENTDWTFGFWVVGPGQRAELAHRFVQGGEPNLKVEPTQIPVYVVDQESEGHWTHFEAFTFFDVDQEPTFGGYCDGDERKSYEDLWELRIFDRLDRQQDCVVWGVGVERLVDADESCRIWTGPTN